MIQRGARRPASLAATLLAGFAAFALGACQGGESNNQAAANATEEQINASSEYDVVRAMLDIADVGPDDLVVDLGSGDGRIPIMAAREKGSRGLGVERDPQRIHQSNENAAAAGVAERVEFRQEDLFSTPLNDVTVLTLYLLPEINLQLRPRILNQMRPGARVVSNSFDMGDWRPDQRREIGGTTIFLWIVPARVEGRWRLTRDGSSADLTLSQRYQDVTGALGGAAIREVALRGDRLSFTADLGGTARRFEGQVAGDRMTGEGWTAVRAGR